MFQFSLCPCWLAAGNKKQVPRGAQRGLGQLKKKETEVSESASLHFVSAPVIQEEPTLKFGVVLGGPIPKREKLKADGSVCGNFNILSEKMAEGEDGAIENFMVYFDVRINEIKLP